MKFYLPNFSSLNFDVFQFMKTNKDAFIDGVEIGGFYGAFPGMKWNGGRFVGIKECPEKEIFQIINQANEMGIPLRFTLTNICLQPEDFEDKYCNFILDIADKNKINEIIINDARLEDYLRNKYSNFKYILSTTKCIRDINEINKMTQKYDLVVPDYRDNNVEYLSKINQKDKIELLLNAVCTPDCQRREQHYKLISEDQLNIKHEDIDCKCMYNSFYDSLEYPTAIHVDELYNTYVPMGFSNFKIEGRTSIPVDIVDSYVYYLAKDEYRDEIRNAWLRKVFFSFLTRR